MSHPVRQSSSGTGRDVAETPESYTEAIAQYASRGQDDHLHCGHNYRALLRFFRTVQSESGPEFAPLVCHSFVGDQLLPLVECRSARDFSDQIKLESNCGQVIFIRGHPPADLLTTIGATLRIDPGFYLQHLTYIQNTTQPSYDTAPLPSGSRNILRLRITTLVNRGATITPGHIEQLRKGSVSAVLKHQIGVFKDNTVGTSIVRKFSVHSEKYFTIEQYITCCLAKKSGGWSALVWLDSGRELLSVSSSDPWNAQYQRNSCVPIVLHTPKLALKTKSTKPVLSRAPNSATYTIPDSTMQSSILLPLQYGSSLRPIQARIDPVYAISEILEHAACSENQFINFMHSSIEQSLNDSETAQTLALTNLRYSKDLLEDHIAYLSDVISFLEHIRETWKPFADPQQQPTPLEDDKLRRDMLVDFTCLKRRARHLANQCLDGTQIIMNSAMLQESRKGIGQAEEVTRLTLLILFFAPASFVSSIFGMNFVEIPKIRVAVGLYIGLLVVIVGTPTYLWFTKRPVRDGRSNVRTPSNLSRMSAEP